MSAAKLVILAMMQRETIRETSRRFHFDLGKKHIQRESERDRKKGSIEEMSWIWLF